MIAGTVDKKCSINGRLALTRAKGAEDGKGAPKENVARCSPGSKEHLTLESEKDHFKFTALVWKILKDLDELGRFSKVLRSHGNNYVRARSAAMTRGISFGTNIAKGSCSYAVLLSVFI